jgi:RNA polymerase sigma-70 factor (ECF subfamily)
MCCAGRPTLPPERDPDLVLCRRAAGGDRGAFALLVSAHGNRLRSFLAHVAGADLADELAQAAFVKAWQALSRFRGDALFSSWLCGIGWRCFIDHARRERSEARRRAGAASLGDPVEPPSQADRIDLQRALDRLDAVERAALVLCEGHGWSHSEAAAILRLPLGTLKGTVQRARRKCRDFLGVTA